MNLIDLAIVIAILIVSTIISFTPKLLKTIRNIRYINAIREKKKKTIKSISNEYDDYDDDLYALEMERQDFEMNRLKSFSNDSNLEANQSNSLKQDSKVNFFMNAISLVIGFQSSISLAGLPVEFYYYGFQSYQFCLSVLIAPVLIAFFFVPFLYNLKSKSIYEYLENKFDSGSKSVKVFTLFIIIIFQFLFASLVLYSSSLAVMQLISIKWINLWHCASVLGLLSGLLAILGLKSIIWANCLQYLIIISCNIAIILFGFQNLSNGSIIDGFKLAVNITQQTDRYNLNFLQENGRYRYTFLNCLIGLTFNAIPSYCLTQQSYQRIKQAKSLTSARVLVLTIIPFGFMNLLLILTIGLVMFAYFYQCGDVQLDENKLLATFLKQFYNKYTGLIGFFVACMISSTVGTLASILKGLSVTLVEDILSKLWEKKSESCVNKRWTFSRKFSIEKNDYSFEKELLNIKANWNPKKRKLLKQYAVKYNKKFAYKNVTLISIIFCSFITIGLSIGIAQLPGTITSTAYSLLNVFHGPILFIYLCARFNHFALKRNHFALNTRSTASKIKNLRIHHIDLIISCIIAIVLVSCLYCGQIVTFKEFNQYYNFDKLPAKYSNVSSQICSLSSSLNKTIKINDIYKPNSSMIYEQINTNNTILNYLFALSFNWYPLMSFLICCISLTILSMIRFIYVFFFCCKKRSRQ